VYKDVFDPSVCARLCDFITRSNLLAGEEHDADPSSKSGGYIRRWFPSNLDIVY
jgi:hypothetical protein